MNTTTTIVIVNYRTAALIADCLRSLRPEVAALAGARVIVVDNASPDDSVAQLNRLIRRESWQHWVTVIESPHNRGFSAGNNIGIRARRSDLYLLLNPDTTLQPGALNALFTFMYAHPRAGIAGSRLEGRDGSPQGSARRCPSPLSELDAGARTGAVTRLLERWVVPLQQNESELPQECDWVSGASMMVRREVFDAVGLLDEGYFLYFEELDLCERARDAGWQVWSVPDSRVVHLQGGSTQLDRDGAARPEYWYDSRRRFFLKRHGVLGLLCADCLWSLGLAMSRSRDLIGMKSRSGGARAPRFGPLLLGDARAIINGEAFRIARRA